MIPVASGHVLRTLDVERKGLGVTVKISTLCENEGAIKDFSFKFIYPELGEALDAIECGACKAIAEGKTDDETPAP